VENSSQTTQNHTWSVLEGIQCRSYSSSERTLHAEEVTQTLVLAEGVTK